MRNDCVAKSYSLTSISSRTLRLPFGSRSQEGTKLIASAVSERIKLWLMFGRALNARFDNLLSVSHADFACKVVSVPPCPVFIAWSKSFAHSSRISPKIIRSGR